jgi:2,3-diketo-5-methylthio-1-phosphopentane phosphatase
LLIDFDGTISLRDVGDVLLASLVADQVEVQRMDQLYHEGHKGSRELTAWDLEVLPHDPQALLAAVDAVPLDETFLDLVRVVHGSGSALEVVSDGVGFHVDRMLARLGLADLPVATNAAVLGLGGVGVTFPYGHPACFVCGTCKRERIRRHQAAGRAVVFVGDGPSDRYAAHHADVIFAKAALARWCRERDIPFEPWDRLADVAAWFEQALAEGRLPVHAGDYDRWAGVHQARASFICGPEVWGPGRTVAPGSV